MEAALAQGYTDHGPADVCPVTGRLYRLAGLRMDGRSLYLRMLGLEHPKEDRVELQLSVDGKNPGPLDHDPADVVIDATGYRFRKVDIIDASGAPIRLQGERTGHWVDSRCRVLHEDGTPIGGLFAIGLATGYLPAGNLGGEPAFQGQTNGLWYYQHSLGDIIVQELLDAHPATVS